MSISLRVTAACFMLLLASPGVEATSCIDSSHGPERLGSVNLLAAPQAMASSGDTIYAVDFYGIFRVIDASDPTAPAIVGSLNLSTQSTNSLLFLDGHVYAFKSSGLTVIDVSDVTQPTVVGNLSGVSGSGVGALGSVLYVPGGSPGFSIVDVSDPSAPFVAGEVTERTASEIFVRDGHGYVNAGSGMFIYDLTDPLLPQFVGSYEADPGCRWECWGFNEIVVQDAFAYVLRQYTDCLDDECIYTRTYGSLLVIDVSDPSAPGPATGFSLAGVPHSKLALSGDRLYVDNGAWILDISKRGSPQEVYRFRQFAHSAAILAAPEGERIAMLLRDYTDHPLQIWDVTELDVPHAVGGPAGAAIDVTVSGSTAYSIETRSYHDPHATTYCGILQGWDLSGSEPVETVSYTGCSFGYGFGHTARAVTLAGGDLWVASGAVPFSDNLWRSRLDEIGDTPQPPEPIDPGHPGSWDVEGFGSFLLVAGGDAGLTILDVSDSQPDVAARALVHPVERIVTAGHLAFVVGKEPTGDVSFRTVDLSDPNAPQFLGALSWSTSASYSNPWVTTDGTLAAVGGNGMPVRLLDVSAPALPVELVAFPMPFVDDTRDASLRNGVLYVTDVYGLVAVDVRDPQNPVVRGTLSTDAPSRVHALDDRLLVCEGGLVSSLPLDCSGFGPTGGLPGQAVESESFQLAAAPNPFRATTRIRFDLPREGHYRLVVYDLAGRRVRELASGRRPSGSGVVEWDGRSNDGRRLPAGLYFLRLSTDEGATARKILRLR